MSHESTSQPALADLLAKYINRQAETHAAGIVSHDSEVTPYEVGPVQPLDPKLAWDESLSVLTFVKDASAKRPQAPPLWAQLVSGHESTMAIAFSVANFPQLMRSFQDILTHPNLGEMRPGPGRPTAADELTSWVEQIARKQQYPQMLLALGSLRLAKHHEAAEKFVRAHDAAVPAEWRAAWENEKAALAWHSGRHDEARRAWDALEPTTPVLFNRGMAALFAGDMPAAKKNLTAAINQLPATSAWHHLGRLYLTLAELRNQ